MKNLDKLFNECMNEAKAIGLKPGNIVGVTVNTRAKNRWGQTRYSNGVYSINISNRLLAEELDDMVAKNTIMHEIIHTCPGCMNHGENWKRLANRVNAAYPDYNIKRTTSCEEKGIEAPEPRAYRWEIYCKSCGKKWNYKRLPKCAQYPSNYRCFCGGEIGVKSLVPGIEVWGVR